MKWIGRTHLPGTKWWELSQYVSDCPVLAGAMRWQEEVDRSEA